MDDLTLAADFPRPTADAWRRLAEGVLKGADFEKKLVSRTHEGLRIEPLYPKAEDAPRVARAAPGRWRVCQRVDHPDPAEASRLALLDLEGGADALALVQAGAPSGRGFGVELKSAEDLDRALAGVMLDLVALRIETAPFGGRTVASWFLDVVRRRTLDPTTLSVDFGLDPVGDIARTGGAPLPWADLADRAAGTVAMALEAGFAGPMLRVDTRAYHEAGAGEAQELAAALATGVAYLRLLEARGRSVEGARDALTFLLVADADEFLTVAKVRALRRLWGEVEEACGLTPKPIPIQVETAWRMTTRRDPWVNLLRATVAAFSAGIGGADGITVLPFTAALGLPDEFARRLARNTQHILLEESNLWRVADPAAGAGGFEALTGALGEAAWGLFQEIEREGGIVESLAAGAFQARIAAVRTRRDRAVATRRDPITGTSEFPDIREAVPATLVPSPLGAGTAPAAKALPSIRSSEPFERLRDRSDDLLARTGRRPAVFLANLGPIAAFTARATFARNFFEAGGIEALANDGFASLGELADAYARSGAAFSCVCSSDEVYREQAVAATEALRRVKDAPVYLAGRPGEDAEVLRQAGVAAFVHAGCDALAVLTEALDRAGD